MNKVTGKQIGIIGGIVTAMLLVLTVVFGSWYVVDEGDRGVVTRAGKVVSTAQPGLNFKLPLIDNVNTITVRDNYRMYRNLPTYSRDQQPATMTVTVNYRLMSDAVDTIYRQYGDAEGVLDRLVTRSVLEQSKTVFGQFNAESAIQQRGRLNSEIREAVQSAIDGPIIILGVQVEDIKFSKAYEESVEQRMLAEIEVSRERQKLEREEIAANIQRERARAEADRVRYQGEAEADAILMRGTAEAKAIEKRAAALRNNASLIELVKAENWDGKLPTTMIPNSTVPFLQPGK